MWYSETFAMHQNRNEKLINKYFYKLGNYIQQTKSMEYFMNTLYINL